MPEPSRTVVVSWEQRLAWCGVPRALLSIAARPLRGMKEFERVIHLQAIPHDEFPPIVYLYGTNGNGKTHMGTWLFSRWLARGFRNYAAAIDESTDAFKAGVWLPTAVWRTFRGMAEAMKNYNAEGGFNFKETAREFIWPDLLMIDDLFSDRASETDVANITHVIDSRLNQSKPTIITSNHLPIMLEAYSPRLADRVADPLGTIHFTGGSHRLKKFEES